MTEKIQGTVGVLLLNLGGPDSLKAVKPFLYNLFSDREIITLGPSFLQKPIAWFISSIRSRETKRLYRLIGGKSPILDITRAQAKALEDALNQGSEVRRQTSEANNSLLSALYPQHFKVYIGMRYWHPFIKDTVEDIVRDGIKYLIVLSLYPQYSRATTGSAVSEFKRIISEYTMKDAGFRIQYIESWYNFPPYIDSLAELIFTGISEFKENAVEVLFSAHSLPESFIKAGDPYVDHIKATIAEVCTRLSDLPYNRTNIKRHLSFQSRSGPVKWLQPATDETIRELAQKGVKNLFVVPISFVSDHIETLYEIDILFKDVAQRQGVTFKRCQSLNTSDKFILALKELVVSKTEVSA